MKHNYIINIKVGNKDIIKYLVILGTDINK